MSTVFSVRYKMDMTVNEEGPKVGSAPSKVEPIGPTMEIRGTKEEIKERICYEINKSAFKIEDIYFGGDF